MNVAVVHAKMEEYVLMESMLTFASVSVVSLERIVKWTSMIAIQHLVKMEVGLYIVINLKSPLLGWRHLSRTLTLA